jgi:hypothetical protein
MNFFYFWCGAISAFTLSAADYQVLAETVSFAREGRVYKESEIQELFKKPLLCFEDDKKTIEPLENPKKLTEKNPTMTLSEGIRKYIAAQSGRIEKAYRSIYSLTLCLKKSPSFWRIYSSDSSGEYDEQALLFCPHKDCTYGIIRDAAGASLVPCPTHGTQDPRMSAYTTPSPTNTSSLFRRAWNRLSLWFGSLRARFTRR